MNTLISTAIGKRIPCFLCGNPSLIQLNIKSKPYIHCNECMIQIFVRGKQGISKLNDLADEIENISPHSVKIHALTNQLLKLKKQLKGIQFERALEIFSEDEDLKLAESQISEAIQNIQNQIQDLNQGEGKV